MGGEFTNPIPKWDPIGVDPGPNESGVNLIFGLPTTRPVAPQPPQPPLAQPPEFLQLAAALEAAVQQAPALRRLGAQILAR